MAWKTVPGLLLVLFVTLVLAQPAAALNADYWRGGWRTPLGDEPHIYEFVIRGSRVTGVYCRNCSDATTIGFIDGTWDEKAGINFTVTFANPAGSITSVDDQHATLVDGRLIVTGAAGIRNGKALTLIKDPRGADPGGAPAYHLPPGTPPALPAARAAGGGGGRRWRRSRGVGAAPYWQAGPFKALRPADVVGTWIASFGLGMNRQIFTFLLVGDRLRGVVCGRCDNPYTIGAMENIIIVGDRLYFDIVHQDWGEIDPPTFDRSIVAQVVQNEMLAAILGNSVVIDRANPPARAGGTRRLHARRTDGARGHEREQLRGRRRLGTGHWLRHPTAARQDADRAGEPRSVEGRLPITSVLDVNHRNQTGDVCGVWVCTGRRRVTPAA